MDILSFEKINTLSHSELAEYCKEVSKEIKRFDVDYDDLNNTLLFSYANLKRFENYIYTDKWLSYISSPSDNDLHFMVTGGIYGLGYLKLNNRELYDAFSPESQKMLLYPLVQWNNLQDWHLSNFKHMYKSNNIDCAFYFALVSILSCIGLNRNSYKKIIRSKGEIYDNFKLEVGYDEFVEKRLSAKKDDLRLENFYEEWRDGKVFDWDITEKGNFREMSEDIFFEGTIYFAAVYALNTVIKNKDNLSSHLQTHDELINKMLFSLIIKIERKLFGYFSKGKLLNGESYFLSEPDGLVDEASEIEDYSIEIIDKSIFTELNEIMDSLGGNYIESIYKLIFNDS